MPAQASLCYYERRITLLYPETGTTAKGASEIRWSLSGRSWRPDDTVSVSLSETGGGDWTLLAAQVPAAQARMAWNLRGMPRGDTYRIRIVCEQDPDLKISVVYFP